MSSTSAHILSVLQDVSIKKQEQINQSKAGSLASGQKEDWPWNGIVMSFATYQRASHWEKIAPRYESDFSWFVVNGLSDEERKERFMEINSRFKERVSGWVEAVFQAFRKVGGPAGIRQALQGMTREEVIAFWKGFDGIGDKVSRNIMMDAYDPRFQDGSIAIDERIKKMLPYLGYSGSKNYEKQEEYLNSLAKKVGITSWAFDRILFQNTDEIINRLDG